MRQTVISVFRRPLARELSLVLTVKLVLIVMAALFLFGPSTRPHIDANSISQHIFGQDNATRE